MKFALKLTGIRARLLLASVGIILITFVLLALIIGGQISSAAQADYQQRLQNNIRLVAQGLGQSVDNYLDGRIEKSVLDALVTAYAAQVGGSLNLFLPDNQSPRGSFRDQPELETAMRGGTVLVERENDNGEDTFYTAAPIVYGPQMKGMVQLSVPASNLEGIVTQRWLELGLVFVLATGGALAAALWLSQSIIRPLYQLRESAVHLSEGNFSHRVAYTGKDEIGEVALAFNEMAQQVESMLEEQRAFASNTSHELRTPLTTIRLRTEALRYDTTLDEATAKRYIEEIDEEIARLGNLIQDLTLLSRFDAGRAELGQDQVDMTRFAHSLQQQMSPPAQDRNIHISLSLPDDSLLVNASLSHLTVVFRNLLDNAIKYTPVDGEINWCIQKADDGIRSIIKDNGRGIPAVHLPHLFERFYRVDKARSREIPGTGLGLALVKSIVEAYGGRITIESEGADKGTTANVYWPQRPVAP
jgi:signal transduction histidine kinase